MHDVRNEPNRAYGSDDCLVTAKAAATTLSCSQRTIWRLRAAGALPAVSIGGITRFRRSDLQRLIEEGIPS